MQFFLFRAKVCVGFLLALAAVGALLWTQTNYIGPLSSRIRALFVKHTRTGNPLVDSVAEHQPASDDVYSNYLNYAYDYAYHGAAVCALSRSNGCYFLAIYGWVA